jgi:hypothetical protein
LAFLATFTSAAPAMRQRNEGEMPEVQRRVHD